MRCGTALAVGGQPLGERKVITALFCDLVGSTELADTLDPEDVDRLLRAYHGIARRRIQAYGGTVEKFIGDAVVGVFGIPSAHEDDPERAVRAALRLIEEVRASDLDLHVRIGICTGETLVRTDLDPDSGEGFATGDTLNIAARLQSAAPVDGVAVADATKRASAGAFTWDDLGDLALKGRAQPMHAWRPLAPIARATGELIAETTPCVGRELELETLVRLFERSRTTPSVEVVTIVAEPGIGKSRLVRELSRHVDGLPELVTWRSGRCLPYGDGIGFWALAEIVAAHAGILETDDQDALSAKLDAVLVEPDPSLRSWMKDRLGPLIGLEVVAGSPQEDETFAAWRRFLEGIARAGPTVLIVEDLHWADEAFVRFLLSLTAHSTGVPLLLVVTARPEIEERQPSWLARARRSTVLSLASLSDASVRELVAVAMPSATPEVLTSILDRAAGSPLYAEQLVAMLRERGTEPSAALDEAAIPATIHALLTARIDGLPADLKPVLLDASVIGRTFWSGAVATLGERDDATVEPALTDLSRREFARPAFPTTMEGEAEYAFWHALVRDVAYGALPRAARVVKHRAAGAWIADRSGGARGRTAEIVAEHYGRALDLATALGTKGDDLDAIRAAYIDALLGAADHAMGTSPAQAAVHARRALDASGPDDPRRLEIQTTLGLALLDVGHYADSRTALEDARTLLLERGGARDAASIAVALSSTVSEAGDAMRATAILEEARTALAGEPGPTLLDVMAAQAMMLVRGGGPHAAPALGREIVAMADELGLPPPPRALMAVGGDENFARAIAIADSARDLRLASRVRSNWAFHFRGRADAWIRVINDSIEFDRAHGITNLSTRNIRAFTSFWFLGRPEGVFDDLESLISEAREIGDLFNECLASSTLVEIRGARGEAVGPLDKLIADWDAAGLGDGLEWAQALAAFAVGDLDTTRSMLTAFVESEADPDPAWPFVDLALRVGDRSSADRLATASRASRAASHTTDPDGLALEAATDDALVGRIVDADGDVTAAIERYERAWRTFAEFGWGTPAGLVRGWLGRCLIGDGRAAEAVEHLTAARELAVRLGLAQELAETDALLARTGVEPLPT